MLIIFTLKDQKITHDFGKRTLVAGSEGIVQAAFSFDSSWEGFDIVVVFSNSGSKCKGGKPVRYGGEPIDTLPSAADADADAIYYVRQNNSEAGNQNKEYQFINGAAELIGSNSVDLSSYATKNYVEKADNAIVNGIFTNSTASADKYIGAANLALFWSLVKPLITANTSTLEDLKSRVELLELVVHNEEITGNPFSVTFATLDGVNVSGVWNEDNNRIDF